MKGIYRSVAQNSTVIPHKFPQSYTHKFRAPALTCAQNDV
jgi:hypothetical protein